MPTIERKIYFFRVDAGPDDAGNHMPFDPVPPLKEIDSLSWQRDQRYWIDDTGKVTCCWVDRIGHHCKLRLGTIRRSDLPQVEARGVLGPLSIPPRSGLAEQTHIVFFENNIVGCDFNFYGPRITRLAHYLLNKAPNSIPPMPYFEPLLRQDVAEQLERLSQVSLFSLRVRRPFISAITAASANLGATFRAAFEAGDSAEAEVVLRADWRSGESLPQRLLESAARLIRHPALHNEVSSFHIQGYDRENQEAIKLDLLSDKLIAKRSILKQEGRTRALNQESAYRAIESAYTELESEFPMALEAIL